MTDITALSACDLAARLRARTLRASDVVEAYLARIDALDGELHAWAHVAPDRVRAQARALDSGAVAGPLHGVPVAVKDIIDTLDLPTEYGSAIYRGHRPAADAHCVAAVRAAGAIVLGKTVTTELAFLAPGPTVNPHDHAHTPGGSSSGSAAAVAARMVPFAFGTQTGGSIVRPASFCGVVGYKPTFGVVATGGVKPFAGSLDTVGALARSVEDAALLIGAATGRRDLLEPPMPDERIEIAVCRTHDWSEVDADGRASLDRAAAALAAAGARVTSVELPDAFAGLGEAHAAIQGYEAVRGLAAERREHGALLSVQLTKMLERATSVTPAQYEDAQRLAAECRARVGALLGGERVLLAPSAVGEAPRGLGSTGSPVMNRVWTLLHVPCVSVPAGSGAHGLPLGVQVIGRVDDDARTLASAAWIARLLE